MITLRNDQIHLMLIFKNFTINKEEPRSYLISKIHAAQKFFMIAVLEWRKHYVPSLITISDAHAYSHLSSTLKDFPEILMEQKKFASNGIIEKWLKNPLTNLEWIKEPQCKPNLADLRRPPLSSELALYIPVQYERLYVPCADFLGWKVKKLLALKKYAKKKTNLESFLEKSLEKQIMTHGVLFKAGKFLLVLLFFPERINHIHLLEYLHIKMPVYFTFSRISHKPFIPSLRQLYNLLMINVYVSKKEGLVYILLFDANFVKTLSAVELPWEKRSEFLSTQYSDEQARTEFFTEASNETNVSSTLEMHPEKENSDSSKSIQNKSVSNLTSSGLVTESVATTVSPATMKGEHLKRNTSFSTERHEVMLTSKSSN
ncbi:hypothetical protein EGR_02176 [Echinococcus granulosus]|uniref:Uncharacterized protein n=1 Tax=Echinococcus granulosus TaxID=6210 RepID=W6UX37_ECHGR|nr:hypothetical protein EGR_02176 [Echinococcus granulosus]EUB63082.1 hypothetical protein EGR_02176 [Echinococcus granulosus]